MNISTEKENEKEKAFYRNCDLKFENKYSKGERNEKGKEYDEDGNLKNIKYLIFLFLIKNKSNYN